MAPLLTFITAMFAAALPRYSLRHVDGRLRLNAIVAPSWLIIPARAIPIPSGLAMPPSTGCTYSGDPHAFDPRVLEMTIPLPSGVQYSAWSSPEKNVICFGSPPVDGMTKTSLFPVRLLVNAIHFPSGENRGEKSRATFTVSRRGLEPSASTSQMSSWYVNATRPSLAMPAFLAKWIGLTCWAWAGAANRVTTAIEAAARAARFNETES